MGDESRGKALLWWGSHKQEQTLTDRQDSRDETCAQAAYALTLIRRMSRPAAKASTHGAIR